jgi:hypothetical protein
MQGVLSRCSCSRAVVPSVPFLLPYMNVPPEDDSAVETFSETSVNTSVLIGLVRSLFCWLLVDSFCNIVIVFYCRCY